ncbi:SDR family NAD(P)-dependent oxidoreductase, partial [Nocardia sp. NPDC057353]|uniref:type I polyketide synthase n=1 Tax=Nocardia sp. NPDC057353 TaxID=3346104 RepID=UPI003645682D
IGTGAPAASAGTVDSLYRLDWTPIQAPVPAPERSWTMLGVGAAAALLRAEGEVRCVAALAELDGAPETVLVAVEEGTEPVPDTHAAVRRMAELTAEWLTDSRFARSRLVVLVAAGGLGGAAVGGWVRSAQAEHPGRFVLVEMDEVAAGPLAAALAAGEPWLRVRDGALLAPRLRRARAVERAEPRWPESGTVLVTGGLGALGVEVARHLVRAHGVRRLLLTGRRGAATPGAEELRAELTELGAAVTIAACDLGDRAAVRALLHGADVTGVVHAAGVLDDGVVTALTPDRVSPVLRPKVDAAWHLHELTLELPLTAFVLFSSAAGVVGTPGQANYAAANAFLDELARTRAALGLPASALAWGRWEAGMRGAARPGAADALSAADGMRLLDVAVASGAPALVPMRLPALTEPAPPLLRAIAPAPGRRVAAAAGEATDSLGDRLAVLAPEQRSRELERVVRTEVAVVLGHAGPDAVEAEQSFRDLGFDSLAAVELRNRLAARTGLTLPPTLVFDHPGVAVLAGYLSRELAAGTADRGADLGAQVELLAERLRAQAAAGHAHPHIRARLRALVVGWDRDERAEPATADLTTASDDELFGLLDDNLGNRS